MTECQGCGAWNERRRTLCVLCGTPLAETDEWDAAAELPPLPPLPDGGLSVTMPAWLRAVPASPEPVAPHAMAFLAPEATLIAGTPAVADLADEPDDAEAAADAHEPAHVDAAPAEQPLGQQADPRTFLREDDFPRWIRELPALPPRPVLPVDVTALPSPASTLLAPAAPPEPPRLPLPDPPPVSQEAAQHQDGRPAAGTTDLAGDAPGEPATPAASAAHRREAWETPLLVVLVVGVVVAVLWALLVNGMIGGGL